MRSPASSNATSNNEDRLSVTGTVGYKDAESIFRTKPISEIRNVEIATKKQIQDKMEELRQLVGNRYRDLIDSADSIVHMKASCESISNNIGSIHNGILSLSDSPLSETPKLTNSNPWRVRIYGIASRVKYLVDTPENIWGCLDEFMFLEAAARYVRAKHVHQELGKADGKVLSKFPLLQHQWQIVESFKAQISQRSRERLFLDRAGLDISAYADALAAVAVIDELDPKQVIRLFLDSRRSWITQRLSACVKSLNPSYAGTVEVFCEVLKIVLVSVSQVGELFLQVMSDMPVFYKVILSSPPASQLYGGIPNPDEEVRLWQLFRDKLESSMAMLDRDFIASTCSYWLRDCGGEIVSKIDGKYLLDTIATGKELALAERSIRQTIDSKDVLEGSLEWLKSVFGSEIVLPWRRTQELVFGNDADLWDEIFEEAFIQRIKVIIDAGFKQLAEGVNVKDAVNKIEDLSQSSSLGGGVWFVDQNSKKSSTSIYKAQMDNDFRHCISAYFGPEVSRIRDAVDNICQSILEDLLEFLESPKAVIRMKDVVPYLQKKCYDCMSTIIGDLKDELERLYHVHASDNRTKDDIPAILIVEKSLFIGKLLFAFRNHSKHLPIILGPPRSWVNESIFAGEKIPAILRHSSLPTGSPMSETRGKQTLNSPGRQNSMTSAALIGTNDDTSLKLEDLNTVMRDLCIKAHTLWISWVGHELSIILSEGLRHDGGLSSDSPLKGWEETVLKQEQHDGSHSEMKIYLPSMPSLYIVSFLFRACEEIHRVGGHVLDKTILRNFALNLVKKITDVYEEFLSAMETDRSTKISEKGVLQIMLDIRFSADVLSGGDVVKNDDSSTSFIKKSAFRRKQDQTKNESENTKQINKLITSLSQRLDPIDWQTFEPYLWENEKQSYLRHAVLFGFFIQLNRMFTDTMQKLPTNSESNILRCSTVPRFKYLPISAPAISSRGTNKVSASTSSEDIASRSSWKSVANGELTPKIDSDESLGFGVASPLLKSFMQVGSRFGESTFKLGSMLTDGQVGIFKDRSAAAMSTFGDILPVQAAGLLSSFTASRSDG